MCVWFKRLARLDWREPSFGCVWIVGWMERVKPVRNIHARSEFIRYIRNKEISSTDIDVVPSLSLVLGRRGSFELYKHRCGALRWAARAQLPTPLMPPRVSPLPALRILAPIGTLVERPMRLASFVNGDASLWWRTSATTHGGGLTLILLPFF